MEPLRYHQSGVGVEEWVEPLHYQQLGGWCGGTSGTPSLSPNVALRGGRAGAGVSLLQLFLG